jgi:diguanylate cyclase (GGDEF)-like protein
VIAAAGYVIGALIRFPAGRGYGAATQPAFILLLFSLPLNVVPALVLGAKILVALLLRLRHGQVARFQPLATGWWDVLPPTIVIAIAASGDVRSSAWPVYLLAFSAQFGTDLLVTVHRNGMGPGPVNWAVPIGLPALLTPASLIAVPEAQHSPAAAAVVLAGLMGVFALVRFERRSRIVHEHRALHDPLTGLANRALFAAMLESAALRAERAGHGGAVLMSDLDGFKQINDSYGHACGDATLRAAADRLVANVRRSDVVARLGGDEFAILLGDQDDDPDAEHVAEKLRSAFEFPLLLPDGRAVRVGLSVGVARFNSGPQAAKVVAAADAAMYADKRSAA